MLLPFVEKALSARTWRRAYGTMRLDEDVSAALMDSGATADVSPEACSALLFGTTGDAPVLTVFSNPYCGPCADMHGRIDRAVPLAGRQVQYVLTSFNPGLSRINRLIIAAYFQLGADRTWQLLTDWYSGGKERGESFFDGLGLDPDAPRVTAEFDRHRAWADAARLPGTPTLLLGGRSLPKWYSVEDVPYLS